MQAHVKDKNTLIINTMINDLEKPELLEYISNLKDISFSKLYDINGNVSGIALYGGNSDIPLVSVYRGISAVLSFEITDNKGSIITISEIESLTLTCKKDSQILFIKTTSDFAYDNEEFNVILTSENTDLESGNYDIEIECITENYKDTMKAILKVIGSE